VTHQQQLFQQIAILALQRYRWGRDPAGLLVQVHGSSQHSWDVRSTCGWTPPAFESLLLWQAWVSRMVLQFVAKKNPSAEMQGCSRCTLKHLSMRLVRCFWLFSAMFAVGVWALVSSRITRQSCFTMPLCWRTKCWGFPLLGRTLRREPVHGMGPEWAFLRKKGWHSPIPVVCSHSFIITCPSMLERVIWECKVGREKVLLTIFFFSLPIFRRFFFSQSLRNLNFGWSSC
jgi:hypothetical protein